MSQHLEVTAIALAQEAGRLVLPHFGKADLVGRKSSSPFDVVTQLDIDAENLIAKRLTAEFPQIGFVGEEAQNPNDKEKYWLVDPIDGTAHFVRGMPYCTTMIALIDKGEVTLSVIYNFVTEELYYASKVEGSKLNGKVINVSQRPLKEAYISIESKLDDKKSVNQFLELRRQSHIFHTISCGYEFGLVASGKLEGRICINPYGGDYDYAAGALLVTEAGGTVANIGETTYDFRNHNFLAVNKNVYEDLTTGDKPLFPISKS
ncbi:inositol monophosphatase [Candidatus Curtissbacteria bacterium]|nr:inositol monophosphatase [Candidatus Curtissbacteria bacterium]